MENWQKVWSDYYDVLGVLPTADEETIIAVYRRLARKYAIPGGSEPNEAKFRLLNEAKEILTNPTRRADYDRARTVRGSSRGSAGSSAKPPPRSDHPLIRVVRLTGDEVVPLGEAPTYQFRVEHVGGDLPPHWSLGIERIGVFKDARVTMDRRDQLPITVTFTLPFLPEGDHEGEVNFRLLHTDKDGYPLPD